MRFLSNLLYFLFISFVLLYSQKIEAQVAITGSSGVDGSYTSLKAAFDAINLNGNQENNNIIINISGNTSETATAVLNQPSIAPWATLTISPSGNRTISGNLASSLIDLNGADNVTIDGLTISNTSTSATASTIRFIADAINNTITNCTIEGSGTGAAIGTIFFSTGITDGNDGNTISSNLIKQAGSNLPTNAIYSAGSSTSIDNSGITISNNNIQDYFSPGANGSAGILVATNSSAWTITGNRFYQTASRACTAVGTHRAIAVLSASDGFTVSDNIIGFSNANTPQTGFTTYTGAFAYVFRGIELNVGTTSSTTVQGNIITAINISSSTAIPLPGAFSGITVLGGAVDIGTTTANTIGATTGTGAITVTSATTLTNISGIYATSSASVNIQNNNIGAINTGGTAGIGYVFHGIYTLGTGSFTISNNTIGSTETANSIAIGTNGLTTSGVCTFNGINNAATGTITITENTIQNCTSYGTTALSVFNGILNSAAGSATTLDITKNNIIAINNNGTGASIGISVTAASASTLNLVDNKVHSSSLTGTTAFTAISNASAVPTTNITDNIIRNITRTTATGAVTGISSTGAVTQFLNINDNKFGNEDGGFVTFSVANSSALIGITVTNATSICELSILENDFRGITHSILGSSAHTYIINAATTKKQDISNNNFIDLEVLTTGNVIFISNSVVLPANAVQDVKDNKIVTATTPAPTVFFNKTGAGGTVTLFTSTAATVAAGVTVNHIDNDFSKIQLTGAAALAGWVHTDAGGQSVKTFTDNIFSNWNGGSGAITALTVSGGTNGSGVISGNTVSTIMGSGAITGVATGTGNENFISNNINGLTSTGAAVVTGISVTAGTAKKISRNKIYNLEASILGGTVNGILVSGSTSGILVQIDNNIIGDLRTPNANVVDAIRAISVSNTGANSNTNLVYNTIYLNATSSGTNFGTTGVYHTSSGNATTAALSLRNNIIINQSTAKGTGLNVAYRRSGTALNNFALASNNNLYHAGAPSTNNLIFSDGTNASQSLAQYQALVGPTRETNSVYEDLITGNKFLSVLGANTNYLKLDGSKNSLVFNSAVSILEVTDDFDGNIRVGSDGYFGSEPAPDIGADEVNTGTPPSPLSGEYNVGLGQTITSLTNKGGLFSIINSLGLEGNVSVKITSDLSETGLIPLNQWVETGDGNYTLTIIPSSATSRVISCDIASGYIRFNGADRVIIDGSIGGTGNWFTFRNSNTNAAASVFQFINDASNNTIKNSIIEGSGVGTAAGIIVFSPGIVTGNDDNTILNNIIRPAGSNLPTNAIYSAGSSVSIDNNGNTINNNNIQDYYNSATASNGIFIASNSSAWTITGNKLFQTATRTATAGNIHRGINIVTALGVGYNVSNNIIGFANENQTGTSVYTCGASMNNRYFGIEMNVGVGTASSVQGNTVAGIIFTNTVGGTVGTTVPGAFSGISILGGNVNVGTITGNTIGATTGNGSITVTASLSATIFTAINATSVGTVNIQNNNIGAISTAGTNTIGYNFYGIYTAGSGAYNISGNNLGSVGNPGTSNSISIGTISTTSGVSTVYPIYNLATGAITVSGNTVQNVTAYSTGASILVGILNSAGSGVELNITGNNIVYINNTGTGTFTGISNTAAIAATANINGNTIRSVSHTGTGTFTGLLNTSAVATVNINNNIIREITKTKTTGNMLAISSAGAVTAALNINDNQLGNSDGGFVTFDVASAGTVTGINVAAAIASCDLSILRNDIRGIVHTSVGSGAHNYIINAAVTKSQNISSNTFTNLNVNTTGTITFITNNVSLLAGGTQNINSNSIITKFERTSAGAMTLFTSSTAASAAGSSINNNDNNFSNIYVVGASTIAGWINTDAAYGTKNIKNNIFSNWQNATATSAATMTGISVNTTGTNNEISGNQINTFNTGGTTYGITTAAGNDRIFSNTIHSLIVSPATTTTIVNGIAIAAGGTFKQVYQNTIYNIQGNGGITTGTVSGIAVTGGLNNLIFRNKIYNISSSANGLTGTVNGIMVSGAVADQITTIRNNIIGDIKASAASGANLVNGINVINTGVRSTTNVYFNTIYLDAAASSGANFGSSGINHTANAIATTGALELRNNIIVNNSTPKGSGRTVAFRRSASTLNMLNNYSTASNNNLFYAGTPGANNLIYTDGTLLFQTLSAYLAGTNTAGTISPRDQASVTESPTLISTAGADATYLHINASIATQIESGGVAIPGVTVDFDGDTRHGTLPDIGADEGNFIKSDLVGPSISFTPIGSIACTSSQSLAVTITDAGTINTTTAKPRVYYKKSTSLNVITGNTSSDNGWKFTEAINNSSPFNFTIDFSLLLGGSASAGDVIQYFVVAQDMAGTPNVSMNSGAFTTFPTSVVLTTANVPTANTTNSFTILSGLSGNVTIGATGTYQSIEGLGGLFADINAKGLSGNLTATIIDAAITATGAVSLNAISYGCGNNYSLTITPHAGLAVTMSSDVAGPIINLNGAKNVIIDGINSGGSSLTISNTNTSALATTIQFANDASNNTITNCTIEGSGTGISIGTIFFSTGSQTGNDGNTISNNTIKAAGSNLPTNAIYSAGTSVIADNSGITISGNNIQDYFNPAVASNAIFLASNSSVWTITGNKFFQTATRTSTAGATHRAINIVTATGFGYTITNNVIGYANADNPQTGITTYNGAFANLYRAIEITTSILGTSSVIDGNTIAGISFSTSSGSTTLPGIFSGISVLAGNVNIGTTTGNTIGATTGTGSITITSNTSLGVVTGIYSTSIGTVTISNNKMGAINTVGTGNIGYAFSGIYTAGTLGNYAISNNTIGNTMANSISIGGGSTSAVTTFYGIYNLATGVISVTGNTVQNVTAYGTGASILTGILNSGASGAELNITWNTVAGLNINANGAGAVTGISNTAATAQVANINNNTVRSSSLTGTGAFIGILNVSTVPTVNINFNKIRNISRTTATGNVTGISSTGVITVELNINNNNLGDSISVAEQYPFVTFDIATSGALIGINVSGASILSAQSIQNNNIRGLVHSALSTSAHTYIINASVTRSQKIIKNTFRNLNVNTTGAIIFISNNVSLPNGGTQDVNYNSIITGFTRASTATSGAITLFTSTTAVSAAGSTINNNNNNFSNINVSGAATIAGWVNTDAGYGTKNIKNNTFSNWQNVTASSAAAMTGISVNTQGTENEISGNQINTFIGGGNIYGIITAAGNDRIFSNTIHTLISSAAVTATVVNGIAISTSGTSKQVYLNTIYNIQSNGAFTTGSVSGIAVTGGLNNLIFRNKIYNISSAGSAITSGTINGIMVSGAIADQTTTIYNNIIGDIKATAGSGTNLVNGINVINTGARATTNVYFNSIYLNASASSGANFGSSGVNHTANAVASTAVLDLRNNIIINQSERKGTGVTVALRRSSTALNNFTSTSNNNLFHAGAASTTNLIYADGTNLVQTLDDYQSLASPRETNSVYADLIGISKLQNHTDPSSNVYLHFVDGIETVAESGGSSISGINFDFDNNTRNGETPDIGADEFNGVPASALSGTYNVGLGRRFTSLTNAGGLFATINSLGLKGNVIVNITSDLFEDGSRSLNQWHEEGIGNYTLTIQSNSITQKIISGNVDVGLIRFNGADRVKIDGKFGTNNNSLTFRNNSTATGTSSFLFINDATNNQILNCNIEGMGTGTSAGTVYFSTGASGGTGNDNNIISGNNITPVSNNLPTNAIYSSGTSVAIDNSEITISNNNIRGYFNAVSASNGIFVAANSSAWNITGNKLFQTATRTSATANNIRAINIITSLGGNYTINNNIIGFANTSSTGTTTYNGDVASTFRAIEVNVGINDVTSIQGNIIGGINFTTSATTALPGYFSGISVLGGRVNIGTITGNIIGAGTGNSSVAISSSTTAGVITGIYSSSISVVDIRNNTIGAISTYGDDAIGYTFNGIYTAGAGGNYTIASNTIGSSTTANSIVIGGATTSAICTFNGINNTATGTISINSNTIQNTTVNGTAASVYYGILNSGASGTLSINGNSIISGTNSGSGTGTTSLFIPISNTAAPEFATINTNIIRNHTRTASGVFTGISSTGAIFGSLAIENNQLGNVVGGLITYTAASIRNLIGINVSGATGIASLSIQNNDIGGIDYQGLSTAANTYILNSAATKTQTISNNTFTDLSVNTSGNIIFISNNVLIPENGTQLIQNNRLATATSASSFFNKSAGGTVTLFTSTTTATAASGVIITHSGIIFQK